MRLQMKLIISYTPIEFRRFDDFFVAKAKCIALELM